LPILCVETPEAYASQIVSSISLERRW